MEQEGVIKFRAEHRSEALSWSRQGEAAAQLIAWREILGKLEIVGQVAGRYEGAGFGNVSARLGPFPGTPGHRPFLITGTQTGGVECMALEHFCVVERYDVAENRVESFGPVLPSSESMTHGAIYDLGAHIRVVLHVHSPVLWRESDRLGLPSTPKEVPYGTRAMAMAVRGLYRQSALPERRIFSMKGHEDGIVVFGRSAEEAGQALLAELARAFTGLCHDQKKLCRL